jgi:hypothetical protein
LRVVGVDRVGGDAAGAGVGVALVHHGRLVAVVEVAAADALERR